MHTRHCTRPAAGAHALSCRTDLLVSQYLAAWNSPEASRRLHHLHASCSEALHFQDALVSLHGLARLHDYITVSRRAHPGARYAVVGPVDHHHDQLHFDWRLLDAQGHAVLTGCSHVALDDAGRLQHIVVFFHRDRPSAVS